ncbi:MAG: hypothetical protein AAGK02_16955 [Pseudomonadota bacterium]
MAIQVQSFAFHKSIAKAIAQDMEAAYELKFLGNEQEREKAEEALARLSEQFDRNVELGLRSIDAAIIDTEVISEIEALADDARKAAAKLKETLATIRKINAAIGKVTKVLNKVAEIVL